MGGNDNNNKSNNKWIAVGIGVVALVAGLVGGHFAFAPQTPNNVKAATAYVAVLSVVDPDNKICQQTVNGNTDAIVHLSKSNGDTIRWQPATATTKVTFANDSFHGGPFPRTTYTGQSSPVAPTGNAGDHYYSGMEVNGTPCSNFQGMGIHIN